MPNTPQPGADCYSAGERAVMEWGQQARARLLGPLLCMLCGCGVRADHVTLASLLCGLAFCPLYFWSQGAAFFALLMHVLLDGVDGPLARQAGTASRRGSFTDTTCDQIVVIAVAVTLMSAPQPVIGVAAGGLYIFLYTVVVVFAMVRNAMQIPYSWVVRPRFIVYLWLLVETFFWSGTIDYVLWTCNLLLAAKMLSGFARIRAKM